MTATFQPRPGDLLVIDGRASVQFAGDCALLFRVTTVSERPTYHGWIWLTGYVRHEALFDRVEVGDLHRCPVVVGHRS
ncbi:hypothetical protein [Micromonospora zhanjiangensis]|uniref:Uncharacterized protein n=1 Tax=Micromonospora zhanjiangensis TaxID=1522057 RepID=A0ABV8KTK3_9ACTN